MPETDDITAPTLVALTALPGAMFWRQNTGTFRSMDARRVVKVSATGVGDIMGCYRGRAVAVETKARLGRMLETQNRFRAAFERAGGLYIVAKSAESAVTQLLEEIPS